MIMGNISIFITKSDLKRNTSRYCSEPLNHNTSILEYKNAIQVCLKIQANKKQNKDINRQETECPYV